jgi:uncharacterized protein YjiS (DUF1127 family)
MNLPSALARRCERGRRMRTYRSIRGELEAMTDADLADIGLRRYQLGHVARVRALT